MLTAAEQTLLFFFQFTFGTEISDGLDGFSMFAAVLMMIYFFGVSVYVIYHVVYKQTYNNSESESDKFFLFTYFLKT